MISQSSWVANGLSNVASLSVDRDAYSLMDSRHSFPDFIP